MTQAEFERRRNAAVENMRQMNARRVNSKSPAPEPKAAPHCKNVPAIQPPKTETEKSNTQSGFDIPFLNSFSSDKDTALILGLLLILMSENSDKTLLFALVYILL